MTWRMKLFAARLSLFVAIATGVAPAVAQDEHSPDATRLRDLQKRCESVLRESLARPLPKGDEVREFRIYGLKRWPFRLVEAELVRALKDSAASVRLTAASILALRSGTKHEEEILRSIRDLKPKEPIGRVELAVLQLQFGQAGALEKVRNWARLGVLPIAPISSTWSCSMHPQIRTPKDGTCPICSMELVKVRRSFSFSQRHAQFIALIALAGRKDKTVSDLARRILTGDVAPFWRLQAAEQWARVSLKDGLPHFRIFLRGPDRHLQHTALMLAVLNFPEACVADFEAVLKEPLDRRTANNRLYAAAGLVAAGQVGYLKEIRRLAKTDPVARLLALRLLGEHGDKDDVRTLATYLDSEAYRTPAAQAMLQLLERLKR